LRRVGLGLAAAATFAGLFLLPTKRHEIPQQVRLAPAW
jgi:magnesium-protoporphyrin IX monomethyl ester (oxidative) cyclase